MVYSFSHPVWSVELGKHIFWRINNEQRAIPISVVTQSPNHSDTHIHLCTYTYISPSTHTYLPFLAPHLYSSTIQHTYTNLDKRFTPYTQKG